jgi:hypothetical protein
MSWEHRLACLQVCIMQRIHNLTVAEFVHMGARQGNVLCASWPLKCVEARRRPEPHRLCSSPPRLRNKCLAALRGAHPGRLTGGHDGRRRPPLSAASCGAAGRICARLLQAPPQSLLNCAPRSRARLIPSDWRDWRARLKDARVVTANLSFCAAFADCRHGATRDKGHSAVA